MFFVGCVSSNKENEIDNFDQIEKTFQNIPDEIQTSVYWYWISDNISKEGVVRDLESMKEVGINRAFIGNIGLRPDEQRHGEIKIFSDEWWEVLHAALKKATELDIEIGIFNSPGWSQSGGPWVKPDEAMRYLALSEFTAAGPVLLEKKLDIPNEQFQDVRVLAFPMNTSLRTLDSSVAKITSNPYIEGIQNIADGDAKTITDLGVSGTLTVDFESPEPYTIRTISVLPIRHSININVELLSKREGDGEYRSLKKFNVNRTNANINVGFNPFGPVVMAVPETESKYFRVVFTNVTANPRISELILSEEAFQERYVEKSLAKMFQEPLPYWDEYLWDEQPEATYKPSMIDPSSVIDISEYMDKDGYLRWQVPEGNWRIIRSGMTPTGVQNSPASTEGKGLEIDKMSKEHVASHFDAFMGEVIRRIPAEDRKTWKVVVLDSYETGSQNWTDGFIEEFRARYNYDPVPFIPAFNGYTVGSRDITDRFLWDLRRLVADKVAYDYVGGLREISNKHGLTIWLENYGHWGFPGEFLQYGGQSDEVAGEFWSEGELGDIENRAASSAGHIYGKRKISAESFTSGRPAFTRYPRVMKQRGDRFFTEGINNTLLHVYIQQAYEDLNPGMNASFGNEFNRKNTWFYDMDMFIQYLKRCNYMLQQGNYVADAAYFIGEDAPKMTGICDPALPKGYSFDYINAEVLMTRTRVKDGCIELPDGMRYKVLVLPELETMRPELLRKISELVHDGAVVLGPAPLRSPSYEDFPQADDEVRRSAASLWGEVDGAAVKYAKAGKGLIASGMGMQEIFDLLDVIPDLKTAKDDPVLFIHRTQNDGDMYFVSNQSEETIIINPEFRIDSKMPELWDPVTGTIRSLGAYTLLDNSISVPLKLEALESVFIVFRTATEGSEKENIEVNFPTRDYILSINSPWTVTFDPEMRGPVNPVVMETLEEWTQSANDSIKFYSGTAVYRNSMQLDNISKDKTYYLDIGNAMVMAKVTVNGEYAGGAWTAPWRVDISDYIKPGENTVEISVVNNWRNRIIGDLLLPCEQRRTWASANHYRGQEELQPSGLLGPVQVYSIEY